MNEIRSTHVNLIPLHQNDIYASPQGLFLFDPDSGVRITAPVPVMREDVDNDDKRRKRSAGEQLCYPFTVKRIRSCRSYCQDINNHVRRLLCDLADDRKMLEAANTLRILASNKENRKVIYSERGIPSLISAMSTGRDPVFLRHVIGAIWNLGVDVKNNGVIAQCGAIEILVKLLRFPSTEVQRVTAGSLRCLAWKYECNRNRIIACNGIEGLIELLKLDDQPVKEQATAALWNLCADAKGSKAISDAGAVPLLVKLLDSQCDDLQRLSAGVLRCLAFMYEPNREFIAENDGIKYLCKLLHSKNPAVKQQAAAALGNLTFRSEPNRELVSKYNGIRPLINILRRSNLDTKLMVITTLRNLSLNDKNRAVIAQADGINILLRLLKCNSNEIKAQALASLWNLAVDDNNALLLSNAEGFEQVYEILLSPVVDEKLKYYAQGTLNTIQNI